MFIFLILTLIILISTIALSTCIERIVKISRLSNSEEGANLRKALLSGDAIAASNLASNGYSYFAKIVNCVFNNSSLNEKIESIMILASLDLEKNLWIVRAAIDSLPSLGLLGSLMVLINSNSISYSIFSTALSILAYTILVIFNRYIEKRNEEYMGELEMIAFEAIEIIRSNG